MNNLELLNKRLQWQGGNQEQRMIKEKFRTFQDALNYSQQGSNIQKIQSIDSCAPLTLTPIHRALINPNKLSLDYDNKFLAVDKTLGYQAGDIIKWVDTNTYWLIYLPYISEEAYFRTELRRCKHQIKFKNTQGQIKSTWAAIIGPSENKIDSSNMNNINVDEPNYTLKLLLPNNADTLSAFARYKEFLFKGSSWQVVGVDIISTDGILEVNALEKYINKDTDDVENEVKEGLVIEPAKPAESGGITGSQLIQMKLKEFYSVEQANGKWAISKWTEDEKELDSRNFKIEINDTKTQIGITWIGRNPGRFKLSWQSADETLNYYKNIIVDSLF